MVIPARYGSHRFPGKPLKPIGGVPMVVRVLEQCKKVKEPKEIVVATDDERIGKVVERYGGKSILTPKDLPSGTDRVAEVARSHPAQWIVNVQGDEPFIPPENIEKVIEALKQGASMATIAVPLKPEEAKKPDIVKVVKALDGNALYFSRAPIPYGRNQTPTYWKHLGIYGYQKEILLTLVRWSPTTLEKVEGLEQLRALEHGIPIQVVEGVGDSIGIDTPEDWESANKYWEERYAN